MTRTCIQSTEVDIVKPRYQNNLVDGKNISIWCPTKKYAHQS